jgi:hypothetical protein
MSKNNTWRRLITAAINVLETTITKLCLNAGTRKITFSFCENYELVLRQIDDCRILLENFLCLPWSFLLSSIHCPFL